MPWSGEMVQSVTGERPAEPAAPKARHSSAHYPLAVRSRSSEGSVRTNRAPLSVPAS